MKEEYMLTKDALIEINTTLIELVNILRGIEKNTDRIATNVIHND